MSNVSTGLWAGAIPLAAGLVLTRLDVHCGPAGAAALCTLCSALVGGITGVFIATREPERRARHWSWLAAVAVATLAASLGCVRLGVMGVFGVVCGMALGTAAGAVMAGRGP
jgi:hypothetical protein